MTEYYPILKGVPLPGPRVSRYPFDKMEVGDCFEVPRTDARDSNGKDLMAARVSSAVKVWARRTGSDKKFTVRLADDVVRCHRIA